MQRPAFPYIGVEPGELIAALRVLDAATEVSDKRVTGFGRREDGRYLLFNTGEQLGGCMGGGENVLLEKVGGEWKVVEVSRWCS